ncbi:4,5-DOPA dioxygenase extradiol [Komagataeibacter rhaeticus]|uniref:4,5-DOPA-extradiol-dioxygenase n=1 Tax=Komagataeibacter rhaeticus TaxID=215221 RepID=UPI0039E8E57F
MPVLFFGHGSPMIALQTNDVTRRWAEIAHEVDTKYARPRAILCISAHWLTRGAAVTAMETPPTIHDFGRFPQALFDIQYPAPGSPALAERVSQLLSPEPVMLDHGDWGLDHGTWSVLVKAYPQADIPVVQLGMDATRPPQWHYEMGIRLRQLRDEGVLIIGTGNIVHNLPRMDWNNQHVRPYEWAARFNDYIHDAIVADCPRDVVNFMELGEAARQSVPSPDHFWPLLYVLGTREPDDQVTFGPDHIEHGSLSMTSIAFWPGMAAGKAPLHDVNA